MSTAEESPAQQAARLRRERREAKIRAGGSARLDKITSLSGRTPASAVADEPSRSASPLNSSTPELQPQEQSQSVSPLPKPTTAADNSPESIEAQEAYLRALLRSKQPLDQPEETDPTAKLLGSLMGLDSAPSDPTGGSGGAAGPPVADILSQNLTAFGLPSSMANLFTQQLRPESPEDQRKNKTWRLLHTVVACVIGLWMMFVFQTSVATYGKRPPPPATAQNPFMHFVTAELILAGGRVLTSMGSGQLRTVRPWMQIFSNVMKDGRIILFMLAITELWANYRYKL
ncbi:predicted protein [Uncinocarpus reesii 1704]|uniref:GET complex, subunit GET2 n=1 Tax=Uncinocarpus reesii (strain UAMH 1704) TaxID=336963 RepID=C4JRJ2_UNCRE|nr:uncharacterized protein UREG_05081 [Uncinocarpus reesii 1704]EEP80239.1 predicted protein [Uncinocarpus reesii 1704]